MTSNALIARLLAATLVSGVGLAAHAAQAADVTPAEQAQPAAPAEPSATADAAITSQVKTALAQDQALAGLQIDVDTKDGVVVLKGKVPSAETAEQAVRLVSTVPGVRDIRSDLTPGG